MKLSIRIPLVTTGLLFITLILNFWWLQFSLSRHITAYIEITRESLLTKNELSPDKLEALFLVGTTLDSSEQTEYQNAISQLSEISRSLRDLSDNPSLYMTGEHGTGQLNTGFLGEFLIENDAVLDPTKQYDTESIRTILTIFTHPFSIERTSPEGRLLWGIVGDFVFLNIIWGLCVIGLYIWWIRRIFSPIHIVIQHLREILHMAEFQAIEYKKHDEFRPLINALNNLRSAIAAQETIRSNFLADLSHEIRTPMTAVRCLLEAIDDGVMKLDNDTLVTLQNEIYRMITITEKIMEHASFLNTISEIHPASFRLLEASLPIIKQYEAQAIKTNQTITHTFRETDTMAMDYNQYMQILHNIFSNFIKYAGENTTLTIQSKHDKHYQRLIFSDNGVGIDKQHLHLVKEKFYRVDPGRSHDGTESMGIGFSIIERIMQIHKGSLQIQTNKPHGLTLILSFPLFYE